MRLSNALRILRSGYCRGAGSMSRIRALLRSSIDAIKLALAWNVDHPMAPSEIFVFNFNSKEELKRWHLYSDSVYGGCINSSICSYLNLVNVFIVLKNFEVSFLIGGMANFCDFTTCTCLFFFPEACCSMVINQCRIHDILYTENWVNSPEQQEDNSWQAFCLHSQGSLAYCEGNLQIPLDRYLLTWKGNVISTMLE
ncbi:unnamed protein product [Musa banksii]